MATFNQVLFLFIGITMNTKSDHMMWSKTFLNGTRIILSATLVMMSCNAPTPDNKGDSSLPAAVTEKKLEVPGNAGNRDTNVATVRQEPQENNNNARSKEPATNFSIANVKTFGAKGDGKSDDAKAINAALSSGKSVYFPAGEYILGSPAVLRNKNNVRVYGEGDKTWIHPPGQLEKTQKTTFYTTFSIDNCDKVVIENMRIESKGENWGNADAGHKETSGDGRTNWIIEKGGHALAVLRSSNITVRKITGRFCGSTGVFYASSSDMVNFTDCFANAASLGYAGFAADNFADTRPAFMPGRRYYFNNCKTWAEPQSFPGRRFSSKGAIVGEGDNARVLNLYVSGGTFKDCGTGGDAKNSGAAISAENSNLTCKNVSAANNYIGVRIRNRSDVEQNVNALIEDSKFTSNAVCGIYVASAHKGAGTVSINRCTFTQNPNSAWRAMKDPVFGESAGIITEGYMSQQKIKVTNCAFSGGEKYMLATDRVNLTADKSRFLKSTKSSFNIFGGGSVDVVNCEIDLRAQGKFTSHNYQKKYSSPISLNFTGNTIREFDNNKDYWNVSSNSNMKNLLTIQKNGAGNTALSRSGMTPASSFTAPGVVNAYALQGANTSVIINMNEKPAFSAQPISVVNAKNQNFRVLHIIPNWNNNPRAIKIFLEKDVRAAFPPGSKVVLKQ